MKHRAISLAAVLSGMIVSLATSFSNAQSTAAGITAKLQDKPLFLRGLWANDKLKFDAQGHPAGRYQTAPFTVCGMHVDNVTIHGSHLKLEGQREGIKFAADGSMIRVIMHTGSPRDPIPEKMSVEIDNGDSRDFGPAIDAVFTQDPMQLAPLLPDFWQPYFKKHFGEQQVASEANPPRQNTGAMHIGGTVRPPRLVHNVEPQFSEDARRMKYSGNVQVYLWVEEDGSPSHVRIVRPAGMGLDEQAVAAVRQYQFSPATREGAPVVVDIYIDVNFQIF